MQSTEITGLHASAPEPLPFARSLAIRAFLLRREQGNLLLYSAPTLAAERNAIEELGGVSRQYLNHWHEAAFGGDDALGAPLFCHLDDRDEVARRRTVAETFSERARLNGDLELIPTPGHTPGATAYLWESGGRRVLFTGDTVYLRGGEWVAAVLEGSSDRDAYIGTLELIRGLEFDVLAPWAASAGEPFLAPTDRDDARRRIDAILERVRRGEDH